MDIPFSSVPCRENATDSKASPYKTDKDASEMLRVGIDIGSTTAKIVALDSAGNVAYKDYRRHNADVRNALSAFIDNFPPRLRQNPFALKLTGSAGLGVSERYGLPFIQEVLALNFFAKEEGKGLQTLIDIGGEDAKIVFLNPESIPDMRMNGNCAGGTGAFIDQMSALLGMSLEEMDRAAAQAAHIHPIASRCGVFSKTDVQNLVAKNVCREDICASIFHAIAVQVTASLSRGHEIRPKVLFCGGPLTFLPSLRKAFADYLHLGEEDIFRTCDTNLLTAKGCAYSIRFQDAAILTASGLKEKLLSIPAAATGKDSYSLPPIFQSQNQYERWKARKAESGHLLAEPQDEEVLVMGVDSGSTTTKIVMVNPEGRMVFAYYAKNLGEPVATVRKGLELFASQLREKGLHCSVIAGCSTGYGEDLIKAAFDLDFSIVETMAHYTAAKKICPEVDFILDIGGQDMKALFIEKGILSRVELNEACSSGCGSFLETFANSLGFSAEEFSQKAVLAPHPCDLGTRCTVFMNSKIKQSLREGAAVEDIAAGLAYSVVKNCLYKVLKIRDARLGEHIVVQGGCMRNDAVVKAFENMTGQEVYRNSRPELMGAYGCALHAWEQMRNDHPVHRLDLGKEIRFERSQTTCHGCENNCFIDTYVFENGQRYHSGNKCEKIFTSRPREEKGENIYAFRNRRVFEQQQAPPARPVLRIGIPRVLNSYADFPFWETFFAAFGMEVVVSDPSTYQEYEKHLREVMSDNICFPAKLVHAHIHNLYAKKPDRIFFPYVVYESKWDKTEANSYNCPIVSSYNTLIKNLQKDGDIPIDNPVFTFKDRKLTVRNAKTYIKKLWNGEPGRKSDEAKALPAPMPDGKEIETAVDKAFQAMERFQADMLSRNREILAKARAEHRLCVLLAGRPYHTDPLVQHKLSDMIADLGACVINEEIVDRKAGMDMQDTYLLSQWNYINRIAKAAKWAGMQGPDVHYVQMTSFGCGPDAFLIDETSHMLHRHGKTATIIKIDDINNIGSMKLRIRSLIESLQAEDKPSGKVSPFLSTKTFSKEDKRRKILAPFFTEYLSPFLPELFRINGYELEVLPLSDQESAEWGLRFANNEVCYPATLIVGDVIKALKSGRYNIEECAVGITQTGGQCRASNYYPIIKKALVDAGFADVPVISVSFGSGISNQQPGFRIQWMKSIPITLSAVLFGDWLSKFYHATAVRCPRPDEARGLRDRYLALAKTEVLHRSTKGLLLLLWQAAADFNALLPPGPLELPQVGIVGEIFLKYHPFANKHVEDYLMERGFEVLPPAMLPFFVQSFVNTETKRENDTDRILIPKGVMEFFYHLLKRRCKEFEETARGFRYYRPSEDVFELSENVKEFLPLVVQFGEGWLLPAEIIAFAKQKAKAVLSLQPFGCIANHIISKGLENKIKQKYPGTSLLSLDFDSGVSEVNIVNRLRLLLDA